MSLAFASETTERDPLFDREVVAAQPSLLRSALGYVRGRDAAEDLVQTVILKALRNHHSFMPGTNLRAWLQTILINTVRSDHRKAKREVEDIDGQLASVIPFPAAQLHAVELREMMTRLRLLQPQVRQIIIAVADGVSYEELAERFRIPIGTVKSRIKRAREFLAGDDEEIPEAEAEEAGAVTAEQAKQITRLFEAGKAISEISSATALDSNLVLSFVLEQNLKRRRAR
ncbi:MAG: sigma-70 family RNA polymerase sigma factor [Devosia sp.]|nr:sigma-70 family RNA polymerase sigma factor [Devosia sp.]